MKKSTTNNQLGIDIAVMANKVDTIKENVVEIKNKLECMVPNDNEYKELKTKVDSLWDDKNKLIGWLIGSGVIGGSVSVLAQNLVKVIEAHF